MLKWFLRIGLLLLLAIGIWFTTGERDDDDGYSDTRTDLLDLQPPEPLQGDDSLAEKLSIKKPLSSTPLPIKAPDKSVTRVVVDKTAREIRLYRKDEEIAHFPVALGDNPKGHKQQEGDERTPEGRYTLDYRNPNSKFHRSIHISYPNAVDRRSARSRGVSPGGDIFIHGLPNGYEWSGPVLQIIDWTDGCIAVNNQQMDEIWRLVPNGTPIDILP